MSEKHSAAVVALSAHFPVVAPIEIRFRDLDALGHVNNAVYLSYLEVARIAYYRRLGWDGRQNSFGFVVVNICIDYRSPLFLEDRVLVGIKVSKMGHSSFTFTYEMRSETDNRLIATAKSVQVTIDESQSHSIPVPEDLRRRTAILEETSAAAAQNNG